MVATPTVVTEMGQSQLLLPMAKWQVEFGSTDPQFPPCPVKGVGSSTWLSGTGLDTCLLQTSVGFCMTELGHKLKVDHVGSTGSTLWPVSCLVLRNAVDAGSVYKVLVHVNLPPYLPLVVVQLQEKRCKIPCAIQHEEQAFSWWQVDGMKKKGERFAVFQLFVHVQ